jgi:hypothetical protein
MIRKAIRTIFYISLSLLLSGCSLSSTKKMAALNVTSSPKSGVFLDGEHIGSTPYYDDKLKPGEYTIRLVPENSTTMPWEARIKLNGGILTVVSRELGETIETSSGHVLSLEPDTDKTKTSLLAVTTPEGAVINVDGEPKGFAPVAIEDVSAGDHVLVISSPGYLEKSIKARLETGYKLTASIQLSKSPQVGPSNTTKGLDKNKETPSDDEEEKKSTPKPQEKVLDKDIDQEKDEEETRTPVGKDIKPPYVTILETPTNWLNVREKASTASKIVKKVYPGDSYKYLETNDTGWHKIELDNDLEGWISSKYGKLVKDSTQTVEN